jgi:4-amino-4-deoxy-L-arabinose transferase-like glycosyltransferase
MKATKLIILIILLLGFTFAIRIWRVDKAPPSVNWDEAALGYNGYSILMTGKDEFGKAFPVSLRSFDDYKPALYSYLAVPFIKVWGLSEISTRIVSVIAGTLLVFMVLFITAKTTGSITTGLIAGLFTAVSPWAIHFSRIAFEANLATALYYTGIALFVLALKQKRAFVWSIVVMAISMLAYHAQRAIAIPTLILLIIVFWADCKDLVKNNWIKYTGVLILVLLPLIFSFLTEPAASRLTTTNILKLWPFAPKEFSLLIYNPIYSLIMQMAGQFLAYFSPLNIFWRGSTEPILRIPSLGLLPAELFPLWVAGLIFMKNQKKFLKVTAVILLLAPLPAVITWNWFSVVRTTSLYPAFAMIAAIGGIQIIKRLKYLRIPFLTIFGLVFVVSSLFTIMTITIYAPWETFSDFQPGFKESIPYLISLTDKYPKVIVDSPHIAPYIFLLFYSKYPPANYLQEAGLNRKNTGTENYAFGKFTFRKLTDADLLAKNVLLMGPTVRIPDYYIQEQHKKGNTTERDFFDPMGYISFRIIGL